MIIGIILRAIFFYFLWQLGRKLWATYLLAKKTSPSSGKHQNTSAKAKSADIFEADFRVLNEQD